VGFEPSQEVGHRVIRRSIRSHTRAWRSGRFPRVRTPDRCRLGRGHGHGGRRHHFGNVSATFRW
jgi:hypothetical protein